MTDTAVERQKGIGADTLKMELDVAQPNRLPDALRMAKIGTRLRSYVTRIYRVAPAVSSYVLATLWSVPLPEDAKASTISRAYARAGTAGTGEMTVVAANVTPATGQIAVAPNGDIVTLAADAITDLDIEYTPLRADVVTIIGTPASGSIAIPTSITQYGALVLMEAETLAGGAGGKLKVIAPGAAAPATTQARLNVAKTAVLVLAGDGATSVRLKLGIVPKVDENAMLAQTPFGRDVSNASGVLT